MTQNPPEVLSYAIPAARAGRFRHVLAILPFGGGLIPGAVIAVAIAGEAPDKTLWVLAFLAFVVGVGLVGAYALTVLLVIGCFSSRTRYAQPPLISALVGFALPMIGGAIEVAGHTFSSFVSLPPRYENAADCVVLLLMIVLTLAAPFALVEWRAPEPMSRRSVRAILTRVAVALVLLALLVGIDRWASGRKLERDCASAASWVKSSHPAPGVYSQLALPGAMKSLSADHTVDAIVLGDGRVILVLKTALGWHHNWTGIVYATGPITAGEISAAPFGPPQIRIDGMPMHFVQSQQDSRHFRVYDDME